jgi:hypothetical protein
MIIVSAQVTGKVQPGTNLRLTKNAEQLRWTDVLLGTQGNVCTYLDDYCKFFGSSADYARLG